MNRSSIKAWTERWAWFLGSYLVFRRGIYDLFYWNRYQSKNSGNGYEHLVEATLTLPDDYDIAYSDFQARIGLAQLNKLNEIISKRRKLAHIYDDELHNVPIISKAPILEGSTYSFYTIRVPQRDDIRFKDRMAKRGVNVDQTYDFAIPYRGLYNSYAKGAFPCSLKAAEEVVNLPNYPGMSLEDAQFVANSVRLCIEECI